MVDSLESAEQIRLLRGLPLFAQLADEELAQAAAALQRVELARGQVLFERGGPPDGIWVLTAPAAVELYPGERGGEGRPIAVLQRGETVGELALIQGSPHMVTAEVANEGIAWRMSGAHFRRLRDGGEELAFKLLRKMAFDLCLRVRRALAQMALPEMEPVPAPVDFSDAMGVEPSELDLFPAFRDAPGTVRLALQQMLREKELQRGEVVIREGEAGRALFCVASGEVVVRWRWGAVAHLKAGSLVGLLSLVDSGGSTASAAASKPSRIWRLAAEDFELLYGAEHPFAHGLVELVARGLAARLRSVYAAMIGQAAGVRPGEESPLA